jgi:hypothetical protein
LSHSTLALSNFAVLTGSAQGFSEFDKNKQGQSGILLLVVQSHNNIDDAIYRKCFQCTWHDAATLCACSMNSSYPLGQPVTGNL